MKTTCGTQIAASTNPSWLAVPSRSSMTAKASATGANAAAEQRDRAAEEELAKVALGQRAERVTHGG
jgi:hypothetical protein